MTEKLPASEELALAAEALAKSAKDKGEPYWEKVWLEEAEKIREEVRQRLYEGLKTLYG